MDVNDPLASATSRATAQLDEHTTQRLSDSGCTALSSPSITAEQHKGVLFGRSQTIQANSGVRMPQDLKPSENPQAENRAAELRQLADTVRDEIAGQARLVEAMHDEEMNDEPLAITGTAVDVTDLKLAEERARRSNEELERRIGERTAELQKVNFALMAEIAERRKGHERFLESERLAAIGGAMNGLAHESRNALQRAQACLEMLVREVEDRPAALALIARIESAQSDLHRVYEQVRDYASPLRLDPQRQTISSIVREAWLELESLRAARAVRLQEVYNGADPNCEVDRRSMIQVFGHLLKNALVACKDPVEIEIAYFDSELNGQPAVKVVLEDNGPGFPAEERDKAFTAFYTTNTKGTGLGLAVSKRIVEAHGGQIVLGPNSKGRYTNGSSPNGSNPSGSNANRGGSKIGAQFVITLPRRKS